MKKRRNTNRKNHKKRNQEIEPLIESDEHFAFIAGYTSNGFAYGLTHEEWDELNSEVEKEKPVEVKKEESDTDYSDLPF